MIKIYHADDISSSKVGPVDITPEDARDERDIITRPDDGALNDEII